MPYGGQRTKAPPWCVGLSCLVTCLLTLYTAVMNFEILAPFGLYPPVWVCAGYPTEYPSRKVVGMCHQLCVISPEIRDGTQLEVLLPPNKTDKKANGPSVQAQPAHAHRGAKPKPASSPEAWGARSRAGLDHSTQHNAQPNTPNRKLLAQTQDTGACAQRTSVPSRVQRGLEIDPSTTAPHDSKQHAAGDSRRFCFPSRSM